MKILATKQYRSKKTGFDLVITPKVLSSKYAEREKESHTLTTME